MLAARDWAIRLGGWLVALGLREPFHQAVSFGQFGLALERCPLAGSLALREITQRRESRVVRNLRARLAGLLGFGVLRPARQRRIDARDSKGAVGLGRRQAESSAPEQGRRCKLCEGLA